MTTEKIKIQREKSVLVALILWFFGGVICLHRLYVGRFISFGLWLVLHVIAIITMPIGVGAFIWGAMGLWWGVDFFLIVSQTIFIKD